MLLTTNKIELVLYTKYQFLFILTSQLILLVEIVTAPNVKLEYKLRPRTRGKWKGSKRPLCGEYARPLNYLSYVHFMEILLI